MLQKHIDQIISEQLKTDETLQPEVYQLLMNIIPKVIEVGTIYKKDGKYKNYSGEVNEPNAIKRVINKLSPVLKSNGGYKAGLVDITRETLDERHGVITSQVKQFIPSEIDDQNRQKIATDIADVILTSWLLVESLPNESGWGNVWLQR